MNVLTTTGTQTGCARSPSPWDEVVPDPAQLWREIAIRCWQRVYPDREYGDGDIPTAADVVESLELTAPLANGPAWREFLSRWNDLVVTAMQDFLSAVGTLLPVEMKWVDLFATTGKGSVWNRVVATGPARTLPLEIKRIPGKEGDFVDHPTLLVLLASDYVHFLEGYFRFRELDIELQSFQGIVEDLLHLVELVEKTPGRRRLFVRCGASLLKIAAAHAALSSPLAGSSPVEPLIEEWQRRALAARIPQTEPDLRTSGRRMPDKLGQVEPRRRRAKQRWSTAAHVALVDESAPQPLLFDQGPAAAAARQLVQRVLPGFGEWEPGRTPALPLQLWELGSIRVSNGGGQGAPLALRLFVECVLGLPPRWRNGEAAYEIPLSELRRKLYPVDSRMSRRVFYERLMRAAEVLDSDAARIPWYDPQTGKGDRRRVVNLTGLPHFPEASNAVVRVVVDLPPNSQAGPRVSDHLGTWGLHSAPAYRALLNLAYLWYEPGRTHYPLDTGYGRRWVPSHDPEQYEPVTNVDLIGLCYPNAVVSRNRHRQLERSLEALQQLEEAGEVVIVPVGTSGRERRILPPHFGSS